MAAVFVIPVTGSSWTTGGLLSAPLACEVLGLDMEALALLDDTRVAGRFPAAFVLNCPLPPPAVEGVPFPDFSRIVGTELCGPDCLELSEELPSFDPTSAPLTVAEDCELTRRGIAGLRLEAVEATNPVVFFLGVALLAFLFSSLAVELVEPLESSLWWTAVVPDKANSLSFPSLPSPSEPGGETNRAVGRGPELEGPLGFFKMGCGCFADDGALFVAFALPLDFDSEDPTPGVSGLAWTLVDDSGFESGEGFAMHGQQEQPFNVVGLTGSYRLGGPRNLTKLSSSDILLKSRAITFPGR